MIDKFFTNILGHFVNEKVGSNINISEDIFEYFSERCVVSLAIVCIKGTICLSFSAFHPLTNVGARDTERRLSAVISVP